MKSKNSLLITTSCRHLPGAVTETGVSLETLAASYFILKDGGEHITIASPRGAQIPADPCCRYITGVTKNMLRFREDAQAMYHISHTLPLHEVNADHFDLVFITGGYGAMWDYAENNTLIHLLENFACQKKPIGLVGHAVVALVPLRKRNGEPFVKGRRLTGFSHSEEELIGLSGKLPFFLESRLISLGALYSRGPFFSSYVVTDGNIITGQNPESSVETAKRTLALAQDKEIVEFADRVGQYSLSVLKGGEYENQHQKSI